MRKKGVEARGKKEKNGEASHMSFRLSSAEHLLCALTQVTTSLGDSSSSFVKKETEADNL